MARVRYGGVSIPLTFDVDDVGPEEVADLVQRLMVRYGPEKVWIRVSSSGEGFHIGIMEMQWDKETNTPYLVPTTFSEDEVLKIREDTPEECRGRLIGDLGRYMAGMTLGRLFGTKNGKTAKGWIPATSWLKLLE